MLNKAASFATVVAAAGFVLIGAVSALAQSGGFCELTGTANISPGLSTTAGNLTFTFSGALSNCESNVPNAPTQGTATIGQAIIVNGLLAQEPAAAGSGSCATSDGAGIAVVAWVDGTMTVLSFTTQTVTGAVDLSGNVIPNVTLPVINPQPGQPTAVTVVTTRYAGDQAQGALAFQADPQQCAGSGVTSAAVTGVAGIGAVQ
jgi:hypothetical protein